MQIQYMTWDADLFLFGIRSTRLLITRTVQYVVRISTGFCVERPDLNPAC